MHRDDLKPCPFCGGQPHLMHRGAGTYIVQCLQCKATTDDGRLDRISANWNRRTTETDEERTYRVLETIASPDNGTAQEVLRAVLACANAWVPEARIIGNVRAGDISRALSASPSEQTLPVRVEPVAWAYEYHDFGEVWARHVILNRPDGGANPPTKHHGSPVRNVRPLFSHPPRSALVDNSHASEAVVERKYKFGERVTKKSGSSWTGHVVGFYSTVLTPVGYAVESERETGSVQIYPEAALSSLRPAEVGSASTSKGSDHE